MDINKLKLPDDWAKDYESPITLQIQKIAQQIEEQRDNQIMAVVSEQMGVNINTVALMQIQKKHLTWL